MRIWLGVLLLVCPILAFAHNDPIPPTDAYYTGSPTFKGDNVCSDCHGGGLNTSNGNVKLLFNSVAATTYTPGTTIPIAITVTDTGGGRQVWGFELAARFTTGKIAGTLKAVNSNTAVDQLQFPASGTVITHNGVAPGTGTSFTFTINWTAPADGSSGNIYFSVAGNAGDGAGGRINDLTGDRIYTNEVILTPAASTPPPTVFPGGVVNGASFNSAPNNQLAQGQIISIFGTNFLPSGQANATGVPLPTQLGSSNTSVAACGKNIPLFIVVPTQINAQLPFECGSSGTVPLTVTANGQTSAIENVNLILGSPGIFSITSSGGGDGAILHSDNITLVSSAKPAHAGEIVVIYATGLGAVTTPVPSGSAASGADPTIAAVTVTIGGKDAPVQYAGLAPFNVGLYQINVIIPPGLGTVSAPVLVTVSPNLVSRAGITVAVAP